MGVGELVDSELLELEGDPKIEVSVPEGTLCEVRVSIKVDLPPDDVYAILIDPDNKEVFKVQPVFVLDLVLGSL